LILPYPEIVFGGGSQSQNIYIVILLNLGFLYLVKNKTLEKFQGGGVPDHLDPHPHSPLGYDSVLKRIIFVGE